MSVPTTDLAQPPVAPDWQSAFPSFDPINDVDSDDLAWDDANAAGPVVSHFGPASLPRLTESYLDYPSSLPGQSVALHVSSPGGRFTVVVSRLGASHAVVYRHATINGADERKLVAFDSSTRTARPAWPVRLRFSTVGWKPGVYDIASASASGTGHSLLVLRTPVISSSQAAFIVPVLDYEAYNTWGGADFYTTPFPAGRAMTVTLRRPYAASSGLGEFPYYDATLLAFAERTLGSRIAYTTDYDLSVAPPTVAPQLAIIPRHMEYVPVSFRDWLDQHVLRAGDLNIVSWGANHAYWQVRLSLARGVRSGRPTEITCSKILSYDPVAVATPALAGVRWRDQPVNRPEGALFGSMYAGIIADNHLRFDARVSTAGVPSAFFVGTGWKTGTVVKGLLMGEGDALFPLAAADDPAVPVLSGTVTTHYVGIPTMQVGTSVRVTPSGARIFAAGTFGWATAFSRADGVSAASWLRFNQNVLAWAMSR